MDVTRRSFLAGIGATSLGLLYRRRLGAVLDSLERDLAAELVPEPVTPDQAPSAMDVVVEPQVAFRPERLMIPGVVVGRETVPETVWQVCAACFGTPDDCEHCYCAACDNECGSYVATGKLVEREIRSAPWVIENISIGDRQQLVGEVPADLFSASGAGPAIMMDAAGSGVSIRFRVRYVGDNPAGARFQAALIGTSLGSDGVPRRSILPIDSGCAIVA